MLSWMFLAFASLRRFEAEGRREEDLPFLRWSVEHSLARVQEAFEGLLRNFDVPVLGTWLRGPILWWTRLRPMGQPPRDVLGAEVAALMQQPGAQRDRLTSELFHSEDSQHPLHALEKALHLAIAAAPAEKKLRQAVRKGQFQDGDDRLAVAQTQGILSEAEVEQIRRAQEAREDVIRVDSFPFEEYADDSQPERLSVTQLRDVG